MCQRTVTQERGFYLCVNNNCVSILHSPLLQNVATSHSFYTLHFQHNPQVSSSSVDKKYMFSDQFYNFVTRVKSEKDIKTITDTSCTRRLPHQHFPTPSRDTCTHYMTTNYKSSWSGSHRTCIVQH